MAKKIPPVPWDNQSTDDILIQESIKGDDMAFKVLIERYANRIINFVRQYAREPEDADDIAQEAFFKAWKHLKRFTVGKNFRPWLFAIARNTALDHLKKKRATIFSDLDGKEDDLAFADTLQDNEPLPAELFENKELAKELLETMETLHPDHRSVLIMHYNDEMTFDEIADVMGKPMNTVKSWHRRALFKIRKLLTHRNL